MKKFEKLGMKGIALVLCLMMVVSLLPTTAFAADDVDGVDTGEDAGVTTPVDTEGGDHDDDEGDTDKDETNETNEIKDPEKKDPEPVETTVLPSVGAEYVDKAKDMADADKDSEKPDEDKNSFDKTETWVGDGTKTDIEWNYTDEDRIAEENDKLKESGDFDYGPKESADIEGDDRDAVDNLLGENPDFDNIEDGTYTKHDEQTRQEVTNVTVEGSQTSTDTSYDDGEIASSSHNLTGSQTTTIETTTTTKTTTTEVTKESTETKLDPEDKEPEEIENGAETDEPTTNNKAEGNPTENKAENITVTLGEDVFNNLGVSSDEITVSASNANPDPVNGVSTSANDANVTRDLLNALDGWTVEIEGQSYKIVNGKATYVNDEGETVEADVTVHAQPNSNGTYTIKADKTTVTRTDPGDWGDWGIFGNSKGDDTPGTPDEIKWNEEGYKLAEDPVTVDGVTTYKYYKEGTAGRTDSNSWIEIRTRENSVTEVIEHANVSAELTNGTYSINASWVGFDNENNTTSTEIVNVLGPSGTVIGYAITSRYGGNGIQQHLLLTNRDGIKDYTATQLAATGGLSGVDLKLVEITDSTYDSVSGTVFQSTVGINQANGKATYAWLRLLEDSNDNKVYVYCAEHGKGTNTTDDYDIVNVEDHGLYSANADHIRYIVENGWWGTDSDTGSLAAVKALISSSEYADYLDEGIAMAATQAAIWYYTSSESDKTNIGIVATDTFTVAYKDLSAETESLGNEQKQAAQALFDALINGTVAEASTTDMITEKNITSTSVKVLSKVDEASLDAAVKAAGKEQYNADVSITLAIVPSRLNADELYVRVYDATGTKLLGEKRVDSVGADGKVTIPNVTLTSGENIKFTLTGTQNLTAGAYVFSTAVTTTNDKNSTSSQTMVGYVDSVIGSESKHNVNLSVYMNFTVTENNALATGNMNVTGTTQTYQETQTQKRDQTSTTEVTEHHRTDVTVTVTETEKEVPNDPESVEEVVYWEEHTSEYYEYPSEGDDDDDDDDDEPELPEPETPLGEEPEEDDDVELPDPETPLAELPDEEIELDEPDIPLADVPATGEMSAMWYAMTALSAAGLVCLVTYERKKRSEETDA